VKKGWYPTSFLKRGRTVSAEGEGKRKLRKGKGEGHRMLLRAIKTALAIQGRLRGEREGTVQQPAYKGVTGESAKESGREGGCNSSGPTTMDIDG